MVSCRRLLVLSAIFFCGCSPALNWRNVRFTGTDWVALFPCSPVSRARTLQIDSTQTAVTMRSCSASGSTFVVVHLDAIDSRRTGPILRDLLESSVANVGGTLRAEQPIAGRVTGPTSTAIQAQIDGHLPSGAPTHIQMLLFAQGNYVFEASVVSDEPDVFAAESFFSSFKFGG